MREKKYWGKFYFQSYFACIRVHIFFRQNKYVSLIEPPKVHGIYYSVMIKRYLSLIFCPSPFFKYTVSKQLSVLVTFNRTFPMKPSDCYFSNEGPLTVIFPMKALWPLPFLWRPSYRYLSYEGPLTITFPMKALWPLPFL